MTSCNFRSFWTKSFHHHINTQTYIPDSVLWLICHLLITFVHWAPGISTSNVTENRLTCHDSPFKLTYYPYRLTYPYFLSRPQVWCTVLVKSFVFRIRHFGPRSKFGPKPEERSVFRHSQPPHHRQDARRRKGKHCVTSLPRNARGILFQIISNMTGM